MQLLPSIIKCLLLGLLCSLGSLRAQDIYPSAIPVSSTIEKRGDIYYYIHLVEKGQTQYSISKAYNIEFAEIIRTSDKVELQIGETLYIPTGMAEKNLKKTTAYLIDTLPPKPHKKEINIAILFPFYLDSVRAFDKTAAESNYASLSRPFYYLNWYLGALQALKEFQDDNLKVNVYPIDIYEDTNRTRAFLRTKLIDSMDLIVGPVFARSFQKVSEYALQKKKYILNPLSERETILWGNPYVVKVMPTEHQQLQRLCDYISHEHKKSRLIVITNDSISIEKRYAQWCNFSMGGSTAQFDTIIYFNLNKYKDGDLMKHFSRHKENVLLYLSRDEAFATRIISKFSKFTSEFKVSFFSFHRLEQFDQIELDYLLALNMHFSTPLFIHRSHKDVINFEQNFYADNKGFPNNHGFIGYDTMRYILSLMKENNINFGQALARRKFVGFHNTFDLQRESPSQGIENKATNIIRYTPQGLIKVN